MAFTVEAAAATEAHRLAQVRIGTAASRGLLRTWRLLDPLDIDGTVGAWLDAATSVVTAAHARSVTAAIDYLRSFRVAELVGAGDLVAAGAPFDPVAAALNLDAVRTSLLVTGPVAVKAGTGRGLPVDRLVAEARAASARAGMRHALNGGRDTIIGTVEADDRALGWARATSGRPCAFCAMLASRGPVYSRETGGFQAHDGCSCTAEPVYTRDADWPVGSRRWAALWQQAKDTADGVPTRVQFRRLLEAEQAAE